MFFKKLLPT